MNFIFAALLFAVSVYAQDLRSLEETLSRQKPVQWVQTATGPENPVASTRVTASITAVKADAEACTLSLKDGRSYPDQGFESVQTWQFQISGIDRVEVESLVGFIERLRSEGGQPGWATKTTPAVFVLEIVALPNHQFAVHRWNKNQANEVSERDLRQSLAFLIFGEEASAREAGKAIEKAKAVCATKKAAYLDGGAAAGTPGAAVRE